MAGMGSTMNSMTALEEELEKGLEVLEADLAELENSVYHLVRSNVQLAQFLDENPGDEDLEEALEENKGVLVRKRHRVKALKNSISDLKAYQPHIADTTTEEQSASIGGVRQGESFPGDGHTLDSSGRDLGVGGSEAHKLDNGSSADEGSSGTVGNAGDVSSMADLMSLEATPPPAATAVIAALATSTASTAATAVAQGNGHPEHRNGTRTAAREPLRSDSGDINSEGVLL